MKRSRQTKRLWGWGLCLTVLAPSVVAATPAGEAAEDIELPAPRSAGETSVEEAIQQRRSVRRYDRRPPGLAEVSQLLWAAQGVTDSQGHRAAPSAGALYPLEIYLVAGRVANLPPGVYRYRPAGHALAQVAQGDVRARLSTAAGGQNWVETAPAVLVVAAIYERTAVKYGHRAPRYVHMEVGCVAENVYLQATAQGLGTVLVGAFDDARVKALVQLRQDEEPLALLPFGWR